MHMYVNYVLMYITFDCRSADHRLSASLNFSTATHQHLLTIEANSLLLWVFLSIRHHGSTLTADVAHHHSTGPTMMPSMHRREASMTVGTSSRPPVRLPMTLGGTKLSELPNLGPPLFGRGLQPAHFLQCPPLRSRELTSLPFKFFQFQRLLRTNLSRPCWGWRHEAWRHPFPDGTFASIYQ